MSKFPTSNFLYGFHQQPDLKDAPFAQGSWAPDGHLLCGGAIMQVTVCQARPALVYVHLDRSEVCVLVPNAPLAAMENELFQKGVLALSKIERGTKKAKQRTE